MVKLRGLDTGLGETIQFQKIKKNLGVSEFHHWFVIAQHLGYAISRIVVCVSLSSLMYQGDHISYLNIFEAYLRAQKSPQWCHKNLINYQAIVSTYFVVWIDYFRFSYSPVIHNFNRKKWKTFDHNLADYSNGLDLMWSHVTKTLRWSKVTSICINIVTIF